VVLRADVSANNTQNQALMRGLSVIAPPSILFFDAQGQEIPHTRIIGEISTRQFIQQLHMLK
jgi:thiol:disulfide interchange protein DsbD